LVEAMQYKKPIIASDIEVFKKIGKNYPIYFKANDTEDLINTILNFEKSKYNPPGNDYKFFTWDDSAIMLCDKLKGVIANAR
ncbi:MAG: hypothetical protein ACPL1C_09775, partial [Calditerrivibrio nitroreducens]